MTTMMSGKKSLKGSQMKVSGTQTGAMGRVVSSDYLRNIAFHSSHIVADRPGLNLFSWIRLFRGEPGGLAGEGAST